MTQPNLNYVLTWGRASNYCTIQPLVNLQNKAVKVLKISNKPLWIKLIQNHTVTIKTIQNVY